jgi:hypothetical protein
MGIEGGKKIQTKSIANISNKIILENISNLKKERVIQLQEAFRTPNRQDQEKNTKYKKKKLKAAKEKQQVMYKGKSIQITVEFSKETPKLRREW